jgi:hypothetical protein
MQGKVPLGAFQIFDFPWPIGLGGSQIRKARIARLSAIPKASKDKLGPAWTEGIKQLVVI